MAEGWGKILIGTRLEKVVQAQFFQIWEEVATRGLAVGDAKISVRGYVAHRAANRLVEEFLKTECDSLLFLDSDAVVPYDIIRRFREYEPGFEYDALQAFYTRRGWPPTPIWMKRDRLGNMMDTYVVQDNAIDDVDIVGLHCAIIRRKVFETMLGDENPAKFDWFWYLRHNEATEDSVFSHEAKDQFGFRLGATTAIKAGHIGDLETNWDTYTSWLQASGELQLLEIRMKLARQIAEFTGEDVPTVLSKAMAGVKLVQAAWQERNPQTAEEARAFYGYEDNCCLYELLWWNSSRIYQSILEHLRGVRNQDVLVVGPGLGVEVDELLAHNNLVSLYELPGILRQFQEWKYTDNDWVFHAPWPPGVNYDTVVAIDVVEHVHPDEVEQFLTTLDGSLKPGGLLIMHIAEATELQPQHYPHAGLGANLTGYERLGEYTWRKN